MLDASDAETEVTWLGRADSLEAALVAERGGLRFLPIAAGPLVGQGPLGRMRGVLRLGRGSLAAWRAAGAERPAAVLVTGGYVSVPVSVAAWLRRIPLLVYLPDLRPGRAVQLIARMATRIAITHAAAAERLPAGKSIVTGYPVRSALRAADPIRSRARLGLAPDRPILLVFGGSQGAQRLNRALVAAAPRLLARCQIVHVCGPSQLSEVSAARAALGDALGAGYRLDGYLHGADMAAALASADLVLCRAGAATLGELPALGLPAILVPLPISGGHQWPNAALLESAGAALTVPDGELDGPRLADEVMGLLDAPERLAAMRVAARSLDHPDAARAIWQLLIGLTEGGRA